MPGPSKSEVPLYLVYFPAMSSHSPVLHEDRDEDTKPSKLAKRRRKLPTASSFASQQGRGTQLGGGDQEQRPPLRTTAGLSVEDRLRNLSPEVLEELQSTERSDKFMPGEVSNFYVPLNLAL